jgi:hypothetical protein
MKLDPSGSRNETCRGFENSASYVANRSDSALVTSDKSAMHSLRKDKYREVGLWEVIVTTGDTRVAVIVIAARLPIFSSVAALSIPRR